MSALAAPSAREPGQAGRLGSVSGSSARSIVFVLAALAASRLVVLAGALAGALLGHRQDGWLQYDPTALSAHLGAIGTPLAAAALRWDGLHYLAIAAHGYHAAADTAFFPLYPLLVAILGALTRSLVLAAVLVSLASFAVALVLLHRLTEQELGRRAADMTVLLLCCAPLSLFFSAVYTESLFLALSLGAILAVRQDRPALACGLVALATITRVQGILLIVPLWMMWPTPSRRRLQLLVAPAALAAFLGYLDALGYGLMAPFAQQAGGHGHAFTGPLSALVQAWRAAASGLGSVLGGSQPVYSPSLIGGPLSSGAESVLLLGVLCVALWTLWICARRLPRALTAYAALALLVCLSSPVSGQPLLSLDRYVLTIFPLWMAAGARLTGVRIRLPILLACAAALGFYSFQFATWAYVA